MDVAALLTEVRRCGGAGAYTVLYPQGYAILWLGPHPSPALLEDVRRLLPDGKQLRRMTGAVGWCFRVEAR